MKLHFYNLIILLIIGSNKTQFTQENPMPKDSKKAKKAAKKINLANTYAQNMEIAQIILNEVKETAVSSHDILSRVEFPFVGFVEMNQIQQKYGQDVLNLYLRYTAEIGKIRRTLDKLIDLDQELVPNSRQYKKSPNVTAKLATHALGCGECDEFSTKVSFSLLERQYSNVGLLTIKGKPDLSIGHGVHYMHQVVILGLDSENFVKHVQIGKLLTSFFRKLPKEIVVIDPLINHVGRAKDYLQDCHKYLTHYEYSSISNGISFPKEHLPDIAQINRQVEMLKEQVLSSGIKPFSIEQVESQKETPLEQKEVLIEESQDKTDGKQCMHPFFQKGFKNLTVSDDDPVKKSTKEQGDALIKANTDKQSDTLGLS